MNKFKKIIILLILVLSLTGCAKNLTDDKNNVVKIDSTGQNLVENILCQPTDEEAIKLYEENGVDLKDLPKCTEFHITSGGYEGIWTTVFVKPLAWLIIKIGQLVNNYGLSIIIITLALRLIMMPVTKKTAMQSENMKSARPELERLEAKYRDRNSQEEMMMKSQEMLAIYKKYKINPMSGCIFALIQIPLFFAFYESMNRLPVIFEGEFLGFNLGMSPLMALKIGQLVNNYGLSIIIITLALRLIMMPVTKKTAMQSENMKSARPELERLEAKYRDRNSQEEMMMKSQEMLAIYKKYKINPMSGCIFALIQIPLFFAFYESMNRLPVIFEGEFLGFNLGMSPLMALKNGQWQYLVLVILVVLVTYFSFKLNKTASMNAEQDKSMALTTNIMVVFIGITSFSISTSIALYWIFNSGFTIIQNLLVKRGK